ncbi:hypothetical protein K503DRAFT_165978 [Rhizopogon vinicolor AM-OR11-026]|uniref:Uncharacterized protein n=1 Tax=Rhizopogon vinicolor AM-OR11-026 TaxID=1314800 RepID=A0A1B7N0E2_9AGAM|nr:hypothetical protein K503DRAFT_165978 [Rhizopogon vinicolor AM-OR11-026]
MLPWLVSPSLPIESAMHLGKYIRPVRSTPGKLSTFSRVLIQRIFSAYLSVTEPQAFVYVLFSPQFHYPSTMSAHTTKLRRAFTTFSLISFFAPPTIPLLEEDILSVGRIPTSKDTPHPSTSGSKTDVPSLARPKESQYTYIPRAPKPDVHAFLPPPPYTPKSSPLIAVPNNTPATTSAITPPSNSSCSDNSAMLTTPNVISDMSSRSPSRPRVGLGFEGLEKGGSGVFDGLEGSAKGFGCQIPCQAKTTRTDRTVPPGLAPAKFGPNRLRHRKGTIFPYHSAVSSNTVTSPSPMYFVPRTGTVRLEIYQCDDAQSRKYDPSKVPTQLK